MFPPTTPGSCTVSRSSRIQAGFPCPGFTGVAPAFPLALDLVSASSEDMAGAGITGATTGMAVERSSIITNGSHTAGILVTRSEEHTSELQSRLHLVCRLLLEKKKKQQ